MPNYAKVYWRQSDWVWWHQLQERGLNVTTGEVVTHNKREIIVQAPGDLMFVAIPMHSVDSIEWGVRA